MVLWISGKPQQDLCYFFPHPHGYGVLNYPPIDPAQQKDASPRISIPVCEEGFHHFHCDHNWMAAEC